jgi:hypothetical protein
MPQHKLTRSSTQDEWRVERIDTEPMTTQQYDVAVTALATLITQWRNDHENTKEARDKAAYTTSLRFHFRA